MRVYLPTALSSGPDDLLGPPVLYFSLFAVPMQASR
jgi:hypothetical protein